jgi:hypothetical protein
VRKIVAQPEPGRVTAIIELSSAQFEGRSKYVRFEERHNRA